MCECSEPMIQNKLLTQLLMHTGHSYNFCVLCILNQCKIYRCSICCTELHQQYFKVSEEYFSSLAYGKAKNNLRNAAWSKPHFFFIQTISLCVCLFLKYTLEPQNLLMFCLSSKLKVLKNSVSVLKCTQSPNVQKIFLILMFFFLLLYLYPHVQTGVMRIPQT